MDDLKLYAKNDQQLQGLLTLSWRRTGIYMITASVMKELNIVKQFSDDSR